MKHSETKLAKTRQAYVEFHEVTENSVEWLAGWCGGTVGSLLQGKAQLYVPTSQGTMIARQGDIVFRQEFGGFSVLSAEAFDAQYTSLW